MSNAERVWLRPPFGSGEPKEYEAKPEIIVPLMNAGWNQCDPPAAADRKEVKDHVG